MNRHTSLIDDKISQLHHFDPLKYLAEMIFAFVLETHEHCIVSVNISSSPIEYIAKRE